MNNNDIYSSLEDAFVATFIGEIIPGMLHNFANPLNGIMGRSKLLQRRIDDTFRKMEEANPSAVAAVTTEIQRIKNDIRSISHEADVFYGIFKDASSKFYALAEKADGDINISELLEGEVKFFDFNLHLKHEVIKNITLDNNIPVFKGSKAEFSMAFWTLIRFAMLRAHSSQKKEFNITTEHDQKYINVFIKYSGEALAAASVAVIMESVNSDLPQAQANVVDEGVLNAFLALKKYNARINIVSEEIYNIISIGIPYSN